MKIRKPMLYCAAFIVCMTLLVGCGDGEQPAAGTFFDAIETSASESHGRATVDHIEDKTETSLEDGKSVEGNLEDAFIQSASDHGRIENKNQSIEMSLKEIQARKQPAAVVEQAQADETAAGKEAASSASIDTESGIPSAESSSNAPKQYIK